MVGNLWLDLERAGNSRFDPDLVCSIVLYKMFW